MSVHAVGYVVLTHTHTHAHLEPLVRRHRVCRDAGCHLHSGCHGPATDTQWKAAQGQIGERARTSRYERQRPEGQHVAGHQYECHHTPQRTSFAHRSMRSSHPDSRGRCSLSFAGGSRCDRVSRKSSERQEGWQRRPCTCRCTLRQYRARPVPAQHRVRACTLATAGARWLTLSLIDAGVDNRSHLVWPARCERSSVGRFSTCRT
jgi:hypothetical protein